MFDAVVNHMSKSSKWFTYFLEEEDGFQDFFIAVNPNTDLSKVVRPRALPLLTPFKNKYGVEKHIWTTFSEDQVDLNYESPEVFIAILEVLLFYISKGAKFIRLDAIAFLWKKIGTTCLHLTETHEIIKLYRKVIESLTDNLVFITETNVPHKENISYFGNGYDEAQMVYNFTLSPLLVYSIMKENTRVLTKWAQSLKLPSDKVCFFNFTASHDGIGMRPLQNIISDDEIYKLAIRTEKHGGKVSYKNNEDGTQSPYELNCNYIDLLSHKSEDDEIRVKKIMLTQAVMLAMPGVPGIYFHSLVGSRNYYKGVSESGINRRINREKLSMKDLVKDLIDSESLRHKVFSSYKQLLKVRTKEKAFHPFGYAEYLAVDNDKIFIIKRVCKNETIYTIYNFSNSKIQINALAPCIYNLLDGVELTEKYWIIEPYNFYWFKKK
jgi:sucrose phosphorylase